MKHGHKKCDKGDCSKNFKKAHGHGHGHQKPSKPANDQCQPAKPKSGGSCCPTKKGCCP